MTRPCDASPSPSLSPQPASSARIGQDTGPTGRITKGTAAYRNTCIALFCVGFSSFAMIYCVQPLLPALARDFDLTAADSALALSLTTGCLALSILVIGALSQGIGRRGVMVASMLAAAVMNLAAALAPDWHGLLLGRAIEGLVLGGVPAVAMAYLAEEIEPAHLGEAMGLYIGGNGLGAMMGRVGMGLVTEFASWRLAMIGLGLLCLAAALAFAWLLPPSRHFQRQRGMTLADHARHWRLHLQNPGLRRIYALGFCLTSVFVTFYNYTTFRLESPPYGLSASQASLVFLSFTFGILASRLAGRLSDRLGQPRLLALAFAAILLGLGVSMATPLWALTIGIALLTIGFFIGHAVASAAVGHLAEGAKGHAASLYLLFYYAGASVVGWAGGWLWHGAGWPGVAGFTGLFAALGLGLSWAMRWPARG